MILLAAALPCPSVFRNQGRPPTKAKKRKAPFGNGARKEAQKKEVKDSEEDDKPFLAFFSLTEILPVSERSSCQTFSWNRRN
jgi:hypothetical protein